MSERERFGPDYIHMDQVAVAYGYNKFLELLGNKRSVKKLNWTKFSSETELMIRKDIADRFIEAVVPGTRALPIGESICGSDKTCCNSKIPNSLYCAAEDRRKLILDYLEIADNLGNGLRVIDFIHHFIYVRGVPCLLRDEASLRLELFQLCELGYLLEINGPGDSKRYRLNTTPRPIHFTAGRPKGS